MARSFYHETDDNGIERIFVKHEEFFISPDYQGKGISSKLLDSMEEEYKKNGVYAIELDTTSVGQYAWALQGFDFKNEYHLNSVRNYFVKTLRIKLSKNIINQTQFEKMIKEIDGFTHSWEFASWNPIKSEWGKHIGKNWMLSPNVSWSGKKILDDNDEGYRIGKLYRERKNAATKI